MQLLNKSDFELCPKCRESLPVIGDKDEGYFVTLWVECPKCGYKETQRYSPGGFSIVYRRLICKWNRGK